MIVRSLRVRIVAIAVVLVCVVLALTGVGVVGVVQRRFEHDLDESLRQRAEQVIGQAGSEASDPIVDSPVIGSIDVDRFAQVIRADGTVVSATRNVAGQPALAPAPSVGSDFSTRDDLSIEDDVYRVLVRPIPGGAGYVVVAEDIDDLNDNIRSLTVALLIAFPVAIVLLAVAVWWLVGRTLRPVEAIRREVADVALDHLDRRIAVPGSRDEVARLATTMNEMLGRLEVAAEQQRRFVADASHELRTPLTRLRTALEVDLAGAGADLASTCRDALDGTVEMQRLVDDLLFLARHDVQAGALPAANLDPVDLDVVVDEEVRAARAVSDTGCRIEMSGVTAAVVRGHRGQLRRLVANLLSNAVRHAAASVVVSLAQNGDTVLLSVADDGTGIPPDQRERVFERFVRVGEARSAHDGGAGLGLAIARDIARSHGGTIRIVGSPLGGVLVQVELPAAG